MAIIKKLLHVVSASLLVVASFGFEAIGAGRGSTGRMAGGWPDGMENMKIRLVRLEYDGPGWDDGMDTASRADLNFLDAFHQLTDFKVAKPRQARFRLPGRLRNAGAAVLALANGRCAFLGRTGGIGGGRSARRQAAASRVWQICHTLRAAS